ncbi:hypothetical protein [Ruegeria profundi]|uniref:Fungal lipase-like domain-containing protein n=1 Tax=Ruegeria profundi TaxID=1685378 RepID=A0A0X3U8A8_9RHOB|nr:hypothetical protein [Ruegeria profundi]KUJ81770.1 hypothetical protein AVO44_00280 [Ruegeria profundi]
MSSQNNQPQVRRRRVFYIPGYDPIHPRRYRELYRKESQMQAKISRYEISISPKPSDTTYGWHVQSSQDGFEVEADVQVLVWSDIVRDSMATSIPATYMQLFRTAWIYVASGALKSLMSLRKGPVIAALYPVVMLIVQLGLALALAFGVTMLLWPVMGSPGIAVAIIAAWALLYWFRKKDNRLFAYYLMHDYAYSAALRGAVPAELKQRLVEFKDHIRAALETDVDEVLVVGHSSGAHLGVIALAELIRDRGLPPDGPKLSFLTLGQVVPMVSFLPDAQDLRTDLQFLSIQRALTWVDISAPGDGCAFALCDPVSVSGVATEQKRWPLVLSAAFTQTLSPERWQELRWRFFQLHFQYLCAFDRPGVYDYFRITAGPLTLGQRFSGRNPSKSRIDHAVSKYRSVRG